MILPISANAQRGSESTASSETQRLQKALSQALDRIEDLEAKQKAASEAIQALKEERDAAAKTLEAAKSERESLERALAIAERAIAAQQNAMTIYERTIELQSKLNDKHLARIDQLETKLDKANSRTLKAGIGGFLLGVVTAIIKPF